MPTFDNAVISTFAGTGTPGHSGDGGPADRATLNNPFTCVFESSGAMIVAETGGNVVRHIEARTHRVSTLAGTGAKGYGGDGGPALQAVFNDLVCCALEPKTGDLYLVDRLNSRVRRVELRTGIVTTVVGVGVKGYDGDGGPGDKAHVREPHDAVFDGRGGLLIADVGDGRVRRLDLTTKNIATFAGTGQRAHTGDGGPASQAALAGPRALAVDTANGLVYICEREGGTIRRVDLRSRIVTLYAGTGAKGYAGDGGSALHATFNGPKGLACDRDGNVWIADTENHAIRRIDARSGVISTVAGGHLGPDGDGGPAKKAGLNRPHGVRVGPDGALYIADSENHRIRRVAPV